MLVYKLNYGTLVCLVYILETHDQSGCIPKWDYKARVGNYFRHFSYHAGPVALVLNPKILYVSPPYHVIFDDKFSIVFSLKTSEILLHWKYLVIINYESITDMEVDLANTWNVGVSNSKGDQLDLNLALT